jgi:hypothetical protein
LSWKNFWMRGWTALYSTLDFFPCSTNEISGFRLRLFAPSLCCADSRRYVYPPAHDDESLLGDLDREDSMGFPHMLKEPIKLATDAQDSVFSCSVVLPIATDGAISIRRHRTTNPSAVGLMSVTPMHSTLVLLPGFPKGFPLRFFVAMPGSIAQKEEPDGVAQGLVVGQFPIARQTIQAKFDG